MHTSRDMSLTSNFKSPVILVQVENEYTIAVNGVDFPNGYYMQYIEDQLHNAGVVVPLVNNDASPNGYNAPGTGIGEVDIYVSVRS